MSEWSLVYDGLEPDQEGLREALLTLGNGYFATRGAAPEATAGDGHYPGTYVAGCYNRLRTAIAGRLVENEDLVNVPNWLPLTIRIGDGDWFDLQSVEILSYHQELDLRAGVLIRTVRFRDEKARETRLRERRLVHMGKPHLAAIETTLTAENWSATVTIRSGLDGRVANTGVARYRDLCHKHLATLGAEGFDRNAIFFKAETIQSGIEVAEAARTSVFVDGTKALVKPTIVTESDYIAHEFVVDAVQDQPVRIEKVVSLFTSRDRAISECGSEARRAVLRAGAFDSLLHSHEQAWKALWRRFDIAIEAERPDEGRRAALILRLHVFHLLQTISLNSMDLDAGVPARGLHGEAYRGHVFWDELFVFLFFNLRMPEVTRSLLMYRYRRLDAARSAAGQAGFRGAMYPWQSGSSGREESQTLHLNPGSGRWIVDSSSLQRHVNGAIAYNIWQYYQVTDDREFLYFYGAEMILEIARFLASIATFNGTLDRYEIRGVMGPDEYHDAYPGAESPGLNNNAYTNLLAVWVLCRALDLLDLLPADRVDEHREKLDLRSEETERWEEVSRKMRLVFHDEGIISQFEGYDALEELDWEGYRQRYGDIRRLDRILEAEDDTTNRYKASKQADVLMLFYLFSAEELNAMFERLGYPFEYDTIPRCIDYYMRRTSHGSTLSRVVHSWVLARSNRPGSWKLFMEALTSDVGDGAETTSEGVHLGAMAGTVDIVQRCYTGVETRGDVLWLNPMLPRELWDLHVPVHYRGQLLELKVTRDRLSVSALRATVDSIRIGFRERTYDLAAGETLVLEL